MEALAALSEAAPLSAPLKPPPEVIEPLVGILGIFKWIATVCGVVMLMWAAAGLSARASETVAAWLSIDPGRSPRRLISVLVGGIVIASAGGWAWWVLAR